MTSPRPWWKPRRSRRSQRWALAVVALSLAGAAIAAQGAYHRMLTYPERPASRVVGSIDLEIPRGSSLPKVLELLVEHGVFTAEDAVYFKLFVLHKGAAGKITAGRHTFSAEMTPNDLLDELVRPQPALEVRIIVPEGRNILEVAQILAEAGLGTLAEIERAMRDPALLEELEIPGSSVEGYLFPDTYKIKVGSSPADVIRRMVMRHRQVYADLKRRYRLEAEKLERALKFADHEVITLASIVEKETGAKHERPLIAGVFLNRLRFSTFRPKLLQTDPTIIYGCTVAAEISSACQKFDGRIRRMHLDDPDNPYNTYAHEGLPPGPISNPGQAAIEAVFAPKSSRYLFFVARNDGTHEFSKTEAEHESWVEIYQRQGKVGPQPKPR